MEFEGISLYQEVYGNYWVTFRNYWNANLWVGCDFSHPGDFSPVRDIKTLFKAEGERIYLLKINKWWTI